MKSFKHYITEKAAKLSATFPYKGAEWKDFRGARESYRKRNHHTYEEIKNSKR